MIDEVSTGYAYATAETNPSHDYLLPEAKSILAQLPSRRLFELGCGNGSVANALSQAGYDVTGVDASAQGIAFAKAAYPHLRLSLASVYDPLGEIYGRFPIVLSLEVIEHIYYPRKF